jgi:hypothetical protein
MGSECCRRPGVSEGVAIGDLNGKQLMTAAACKLHQGHLLPVGGPGGWNLDLQLGTVLTLPSGGIVNSRFHLLGELLEASACFR